MGLIIGGMGIALPYVKHHYEFINSIETSMGELEIIIFWCDKEEVKLQDSNLIGCN